MPTATNFILAVTKEPGVPLTQIQGKRLLPRGNIVRQLCQSQSVTPMMTFDPAKSARMPNRSFVCKITFQADTNLCPKNEIKQFQGRHLIIPKASEH